MAQPQIKYCGNHSLLDFQQTIASRADFIGVVFAESKRKVNASDLADWLTKIQLQNQQKLVGLFVNPTVAEVKNVLKDVPLDIIQCHGTESREAIIVLKKETSLPVWKAIHHEDNAVEKMRQYEGVADGFVVDCKVSGKWGGTGKSFDWSYTPHYLQEGRRQGVPCFIAGGVKPDNISALLPYKPEGIDLSSGIEHKGFKNKREIERLEERIFNNEANFS